MDKVIGLLITALLRMLSPELFKKAVNSLIEVIEDGCRRTENLYDNEIILPICSTIRTALNIPDEDGDNV